MLERADKSEVSMVYLGSAMSACLLRKPSTSYDVVRSEHLTLSCGSLFPRRSICLTATGQFEAIYVWRPSIVIEKI